MPRRGQLTFPYESADAGNAAILAGTTIDITWQDAPPGAVAYDFYFIPDGASQSVPIAGDPDPSDGVSVMWTVPEHLAGSLSALATFADGSTIRSGASLTIFSGKAIPADICTIRSTSIGVIDVFRGRSVNSGNFAYITPGMFQPVLGRTSDNWFLVDATGAYDVTSGTTVSGMGWVSGESPIGLFGPCGDLPTIE